MVRRFSLILACAAALSAQDSTPRANAGQYPAHVSLAAFDIGVEYLVHSIPTKNGVYFTKDYLVLDVGVFPTAAGNSQISSGQFRLRINHASSLDSDTAGTVAASIHYPDWEQRPRSPRKPVRLP